jgi:ribosomal protein S18 acetylase RimI-like enzyme
MSRLSGVYVKEFTGISRNRFVYPKMGRQFLFTRFIRYYRRKGIVNTICHAFQKIRELLFRKPDILFFVDLPRLKNEEYIISDNVGVECVRSEAEISKQDLNMLFEHISEKIFAYYMEERFSKGALLWLVKVDGMLAGYIWSIAQRTIKPYYFPMTEKDVHLFDNFIFEELRGRGINQALVNYVLAKLRKKGLARAFIETNVANTPEIRALAKTGFVKFGLGRKYHIHGYCVAIWSKVTYCIRPEEELCE